MNTSDFTLVTAETEQPLPRQRAGSSDGGGGRAREHLPTRRRLFGERWYHADNVDELIDDLEGALADQMAKVSELAGDNERLRTLEHHRRHGLLGPWDQSDDIDPDQVHLVMRAQQTADQIVADAAAQAAMLVDSARRQHLDTAPQDPAAPAGGDPGWQVRAEQAEARLADLAPFLRQFSDWLTRTADQQADAAQAQAAQLREAATAVGSALADLPRSE